jgi:hypothetical protein
MTVEEFETEISKRHPSWRFSSKEYGIALWIAVQVTENRGFAVQVTPADGIGVSIIPRGDGLNFDGADEVFTDLREVLDHIECAAD